MIDSYNGELADIIPHNLLGAETKALSYSMKRGLQRLQGYAKTCAVYAAIDQVPESVLDLMAVELNTQYYDRNYSVEIKKKLIRQTVTWYMHSGTPSVLEEFLGTIFSGGFVEEWYDYGGEPYFFRINVVVNEWEVNQEVTRSIRQQIEIYKNQRSWLDKLVYLMQFQYEVKIRYENQICFQSAFYPRYNLAFHSLEGAHVLDGSKRLNGYDTDAFIDFYPVAQRITGDVRAGPLASQRLRIMSAAHNDAEGRGGLRIQAGVWEEVGVGTAMAVHAVCRVGVSYDNTLTVEKNLQYLDGAGILDGTNLLNADRYMVTL